MGANVAKKKKNTSNNKGKPFHTGQWKGPCFMAIFVCTQKMTNAVARKRNKENTEEDNKGQRWGWQVRKRELRIKKTEKNKRKDGNKQDGHN